MTAIEHDMRCVDDLIDGAINFRDLGGYPALGGRVRRGMVYRSGMTHFISESGWQRLATDHGLRTVIDLRSDGERSGEGLASLAAFGIAQYHAPVFADTGAIGSADMKRRFAAMRTGTYDWTVAYEQMLEVGATAFRHVFDMLARHEARPLVFHCTGGRDRTGVAAALVLSVLGVADDVIATDYALTGTYLRRHVDRFAGPAQRMDMTIDEMARMLETREEAMLRLLELVAARHGSVEGYVLDIGVTSEVIEDVRAALVEPAA
jgi:protein-tyrosine phosphatase